MKWNKNGNPEKSGEYIVFLNTAQGPKIDILNYGITEQYPAKNWYLVGVKGYIYFDNIIAWAEMPKYEEVL